MSAILCGCCDAQLDDPERAERCHVCGAWFEDFGTREVFDDATDFNVAAAELDVREVES